MLNIVLALMMALPPIVVKLYPEGNQTAPVDLLVFAYVERHRENKSVECLLLLDGAVVAGSTQFTGRDDNRTLFTFEYKRLGPGTYVALITLLRISVNASGQEIVEEISQRSSELRVQ